MADSTSKTARASRLVAAATAVVVAIAVASTPDTSESAIPRPASAAPVQSITVDLTASALNTAAITPARRSVAATPQATVSLPTPTTVVAVAATVAVAAAWYAAFPITLPGSFAAATLFNVLVRGVSMQPITIDPPFVLQWGLSIFVGTPVLLGVVLAQAVDSGLKSISAQADSTRVARPSATRSTRTGLAGSRRTAAPSTNAPARRAAKNTAKPPTAKKHSGTAGSGRTVSKAR
jgi:hypothetical protein